MFRIEEISYLYLLAGIPMLVIVFYFLLMWKTKDMVKLGDLGLIDRLSPMAS